MVGRGSVAEYVLCHFLHPHWRFARDVLPCSLGKLNMSSRLDESESNPDLNDKTNPIHKHIHALCDWHANAMGYNKVGAGDSDDFVVDSVYKWGSGGVLGGGKGRPSKSKRKGTRGGAADDADAGFTVPDSETLAVLLNREAELASDARAKFVRALAAALSEARLPGLDISADASLEEVTAALRKAIPDPSRPGGGFTADKTMQVAACRAVARVLNKQFTPGARERADKFIDDALDAPAICEQVGEFAHSFASGINTDFLAVHATVRNVLARLSLLDELLQRAYERIAAVAINSSDSEAAAKAAALDSVYRALRAEIQRATEVLTNVHHVALAPADAALATALASSANSRALVKRLGLKPGTTAFGSTIAAALSGLGSAAAVTASVDRALKAAGLSVDAYLASKSAEDLDAKLADLTANHIADGTLETFIRAKNELTQMFARTHAHYKKAEGAGEYRGGAAVDIFGELDIAKSPLERRLDQQRLDRKLILTEFARQLARKYAALLAAVNSIGPKFGKSVPIGGKFDHLRDMVKALSGEASVENMSRLNEALSGVFIDADSISRKAAFVNALRSVARACDAAAAEAGAGAADVAAIKSSVESIEKLIDSFSDAVTRKLGTRRDLPVSFTKSATGAGEDMRVGGAADDSAIAEFATGNVTLVEAISKFVYFYYIAHIRANLATTSAQIAEFGADYESTLGIAMAERIYRINSSVKAKTDLVNIATNDTVSTDRIKKFANDGADVDIAMCKVAQAVDLYLKAFAQTSSASPDDFIDIRADLEETQMIARWFTETTGNKIVAAFEAFNDNGLNSDFDSALTSEHYYNKITADFTPVNPSTVITVGQANIRGPGAGAQIVQDRAVCAIQLTAVATSMKKVSEAVDMYQGLKNLISAFVHIGSRSAGASNVFMTPAQIFRDLTAYLKSSAIGCAIGDPAAADKVTQVRFQWRSIDAINHMDEVISTQKYFTDQLFVMVVKAMAAKVLTTLGAFEVFDKGANVTAIWQIRSILGGAAGDSTVNADAAALYFRLPRLAEFYRTMLNTDGFNGDDATTFKIAMLPDASGLFGGFIFKMFYQFGTSAASGDYNDTELREIIAEINSIHAHFSSKGGDTTQLAVAAFVAEINRRFGLVSKSDVKTYNELVTQNRSGSSGIANDTLFSILPGEDDFNGKVGIAPSDTYTAAAARAAPVAGDNPFAKVKRKIDTSRSYAYDDNAVNGHKALITKFRQDLDKKFKSNKSHDSIAYGMRIRRAADEIRKSPAKAFEIASKLITATSNANADDDIKLMFNETVVHGLNILSAITDAIDTFADTVNGCTISVVSKLLQDIHTWTLKPASQLAGAAAAANVAPPVLPELIEKISTEYPKYSKDFVTTVFRRYLNRNSQLAGAIPISATRSDSRVFHTQTAANDVATGLNLTQVLFTAAIGTLDIYMNKGQMLGDLIDACTEIMADMGGLVVWSEGAGQIPRVSLGKLQAVAESLFSDVKMFVSLVGDQLPSEYVKKYVQGADSVGTVAYIETNLISKRFREPLSDTSTAVTLDALTARITKAFSELIEKKSDAYCEIIAERTHYALVPELLPMHADVATDLSPRISIGYASYDEMTKGINRLIRSGPIDTSSSAIGMDAAIAASKLTMRSRLWADIGTATTYNMCVNNAPGMDNLTNQVSGFYSKLYSQGFVCDKLETDPPANPMPNGANPATPPKNAHSRSMLALTKMATTATQQRGLMFQLNQVVHAMLDACTDPSSMKIYAPLVTSLVNSTFGMAVGDPAKYAHPDLMPRGTTPITRPDPEPTALIMQSIAFILQRMSRDQIAGEFRYQYPVLIDVPVYMKEKYRVVLPYVVSRMNSIIARANFIKQILKTKIELRRNYTNAVEFTDVIINTTAVPVAAFTVCGNAAAVGEFEGIINDYGHVSVINANIAANPNSNIFPTVLFMTNPIEYGYLNTINIDPSAIPRNRFLFNLTDKSYYGLGGLRKLNPQADPAPAGDLCVSSLIIKTLFNQIIESTINIAANVQSAAMSVVRELGDEMTYFETGENSIANYKSAHGAEPFMPLSLIAQAYKTPVLLGGDYNVLIDNTVGPAAGGPPAMPERTAICRIAECNNINPFSSSASNDFKYAYGLRGVFGLKAPASALVGAAAALRGYNEVVDGTSRVAPDVYARFVDNAVGLARFVFGKNQVAAALTYSLPPAGDTLLTKLKIDYNASRAVPALGIDIPKIIAIVEASDPAAELRDYVKTDNALVGINARSDECISSIVDMNIMPFNVHAMMRDVPLANLYNYEYTFDELTRMTFGVKTIDALRDLNSVINESADGLVDAFVKLTINPYAAVTDNAFDADGAIGAIMRGDPGLGMGRPKFLSDQIYNKVLLKSIWRSPAGAASPRGPTVSGIVAGVGKITQALAEMFDAVGAKIHIMASYLAGYTIGGAAATDTLKTDRLLAAANLKIVSGDSQNYDIGFGADIMAAGAGAAIRYVAASFGNGGAAAATNGWIPNTAAGAAGVAGAVNANVYNAQQRLIALSAPGGGGAYARADTIRAFPLNILGLSDQRLGDGEIQRSALVNFLVPLYMYLLGRAADTLTDIDITSVNAPIPLADRPEKPIDATTVVKMIANFHDNQAGAPVTRFLAETLFGPAVALGEKYNPRKRWLAGLSQIDNLMYQYNKFYREQIMTLYNQLYNINYIVSDTNGFRGTGIGRGAGQFASSKARKILTGFVDGNDIDPNAALAIRTTQIHADAFNDIKTILTEIPMITDSYVSNKKLPLGLMYIHNTLAASISSSIEKYLKPDYYPLTDNFIISNASLWSLMLYYSEAFVVTRANAILANNAILASAVGAVVPVAAGNLLQNHNTRDIYSPYDIRYITKGRDQVTIAAAGNTPQVFLTELNTIQTLVGYIPVLEGSGYMRNTTSIKGDGTLTEYAVIPTNASKTRFDTIFIRNLIFVTNVSRVVRLRLMRALALDRHVLVKSHAVVAPGLTEYGFDPYSPNETTDSTAYDSRSHFIARDDGF